ncbi:hypothetical protein BDF21DRAFT_417051 [Thamnidium elegans]|nr:hypothetical protein BDF21DRAFT_417051 [Thamnidium elegans]
MNITPNRNSNDNISYYWHKVRPELHLSLFFFTSFFLLEIFSCCLIPFALFSLFLFLYYLLYYIHGLFCASITRSLYQDNSMVGALLVVCNRTQTSSFVVSNLYIQGFW